MKKNISINLQGLIFHIEEDGYEQLGRYLAEVKAHFAPYRGHQDIVADIEGRIAELFAARLSPTQQVITQERRGSHDGQNGPRERLPDRNRRRGRIGAGRRRHHSRHYCQQRQRWLWQHQRQRLH